MFFFVQNIFVGDDVAALKVLLPLCSKLAANRFEFYKTKIFNYTLGILYKSN